MRSLTGGGAFTAKNISDLNANFTEVLAGITPGAIIYCWPGYTSLQSAALQDGSQSNPFSTLLAAYNATTAANNDVVVLVGNGGTTGTARVEAAFTWSKSATHLIGVTAPVYYSQRARIAPTGSTTAFTPFFTISGSGCVFRNIQWWHGFDTGTTSSLNVVVSGSRNLFANCHFAGMGDAASAQSAGSRSLKIGSGGSGENVFVDCVIGIDTVTRTAANASVEFAGATARNVFRNCLFPLMTSSATVLGVLGTGNGCVDRHNVFDNCSFVNAVSSTSTAMTVLGSFTTASPGGLLLYKQCILVGITDYGDTNALANSYVDGFTGAAATSGIAVKPS